MDYSWFSWGNWVFPVLCLVFMAVMMLACRGMHFGCGHRSHSSGGRETPQRILDLRYASGQISKEQYEAMRRDLKA